MTRDFNILIEEDKEGVLVASVPEFKSCHTQARSLDELMKRIREAIELCLEVEESTRSALRFVGFQRMTVEV